MHNNKNRLLIFSFIIIAAFIFTGCKSFDEIKVKLGVKNNDFEYIKQGRIKKIIIQSTRDKSFRFVVTDEIAIKDLYDILSTSKEVSTASTLESDYIFEMYEGVDKVHKFSYIAGLDEKDGANLYSADKSYIVSKRIDNDIIQNFWNIRKPLDFKTVYYDILSRVVHNDKFRSFRALGVRSGYFEKENENILILKTGLKFLKSGTYIIESNFKIINKDIDDINRLYISYIQNNKTRYKSPYITNFYKNEDNKMEFKWSSLMRFDIKSTDTLDINVCDEGIIELKDIFKSFTNSSIEIYYIDYLGLP